MTIGVWNQYYIASSAITGPMCSDGSYIYFEIRTNAAAHTLYKFSIASKTVVASVSVPGNGNFHGPICTNGTHVLIATSNGPRAFLCSDLTDLGVVIANTNIGYINGEMGGAGYYDGTYFWFGGMGQPNQINRITPGSWALSTYGTTANHTLSISRISGIENDLLISGYTMLYGCKRVTKTGTVVWDDALHPGYVNGQCYDPATGLVWLTDASCEHVTVRGSDGLMINRLGSQVATWALAKVNATEGDSLISAGYGIIICGDTMVSGSSVLSPGSVQRRGTGSPRYNSGVSSSSGTYAPHARPLASFCKVGATVYGAPNGNNAFGWAGIVWMDFTKADANLTNVTPRDAAKLRLTFDAAVGMTGPTLGPTVGPVGVSAATQVDSTNIDVSLDIHKPVTGIGF